MKPEIQMQKRAVLVAVFAMGLAAFVPQSKALDSLTNGLAAYWPMDSITSSTLTPDLGPNGFDLYPYNSSAIVPFNGVNITQGILGGPHSNVNGTQNGTNCLVTTRSQATIFGYIAPVTTASQLTNLLVPPLNQPNWTFSFWVKAPINSDNTGNRIWAIAEKPLGNGPNLLWDLTQNNQGDPTQLGHFRRSAAQVISGIQFLDDNGSGDQVDTVSNSVPSIDIFDNNWHNITFIAQMITNVPGTAPVIDPTQMDPGGQILNASLANIVWTSAALDSNTNNAPKQVNTNQVYQIAKRTDLSAPWTVIGSAPSAGNDVPATFGDNSATNPVAFYTVIKPSLRLQTRSLYVDGQRIPTQQGDSIDAFQGNGALQSWPSKTGALYRLNGYFFCDTFMFGGFLRAAGEGGQVDASYSDAAVWNRALSTNELAAYIRDGITNASVFQAPLFASLISAFPVTAVGDTNVITWSAAKPPATLTLNPGYGNVTGVSSAGNGSTNATVNSNTVFQIVATRSGLSATGTVSVICVSNVAPNWHYIDSYTYLNDGTIAGQGGWLNPVTGPATDGANYLVPLRVYTANDGNQFVGFDGFDFSSGAGPDGAVAGRNLAGFLVPPLSTNTLFFRFYIPPASTNSDPNFSEVAAFQLELGLSDVGIVDAAINGGAAGGPSLQLIQPLGGGPIDLQCSSGASGYTVAGIPNYTPGTTNFGGGPYSFTNDIVNGDTNGLIAGHVYNVWIDVINTFTNSSDSGCVGGYASNTEQTNADYYAVWLQRDDWAQRTNLFSAITLTNTTTSGIMNGSVYPTGYMLSPRDFSTSANQVNTLLGPPSANLRYLYMVEGQSQAQQPTNSVSFDDFYISKAGFNSTVPVSAGSFTP